MLVTKLFAVAVWIRTISSLACPECEANGKGDKTLNLDLDTLGDVVACVPHYDAKGKWNDCNDHKGGKGDVCVPHYKPDGTWDNCTDVGAGHMSTDGHWDGKKILGRFSFQIVANKHTQAPAVPKPAIKRGNHDHTLAARHCHQARAIRLAVEGEGEGEGSRLLLKAHLYLVQMVSVPLQRVDWARHLKIRVPQDLPLPTRSLLLVRITHSFGFLG